MSCLNSDYIRQLRYISNQKRNFSVGNDNAQNVKKERASVNCNDEENLMLPANNKSLERKQSNTTKQTSVYSETAQLHKVKHSTSIISSSKRKDRCCSFLFSNRKNDFFNENRASFKSLKNSKCSCFQLSTAIP